MRLSSFFTNNANVAGNISAGVNAKVGQVAQDSNAAPLMSGASVSADKATLSAMGQLQSALASFQGVVQSLSGKGFNLSASSSSTEVLTAVTSSRSVAGSYTVDVTQLAQSQVLRSQALASPDAAIGQGIPTTLSFDFGSASGNTFATSPAASGGTLDIPGGSNTLQGIADAVNGAGIGVAAKVIASTSGYALELTSPTGTANSLRINVSGDPALQDLLSYNTLGVKNLNQTTAPQDATLAINGVEVKSASNTIIGVVPGTTLSLVAKGSARLSVAQGPAQFAQNVTNFVTDYNSLNAKLSATAQGDPSAGVAALRIQSQLADIVNSDTGGGAALATIGVGVQSNGDLVIDANLMQQAINANSVAVSMLFTNSGKGIADMMASRIQDLIGPVGSLSAKTGDLHQADIGQNVAVSSADLALTAQANALVNVYSQQVLQGYTMG